MINQQKKLPQNRQQLCHKLCHVNLVILIVNQVCLNEQIKAHGEDS